VANAKIIDDNGNLKSPKTQITLRHLLTHTAGYSYTFFDHKIKAWGEKTGHSEFTGRRLRLTSP
jgi:CubicO group peptidase (beta-lactamase class C family)